MATGINVSEQLENTPPLNKAKLRFHCRRGMLELDVLLQPFCDEVFDTLPLAQQQTFARLLDQEDPDLFGWLMQHSRSEDAQLQAMIEIILQRVQP